MSSQGTLSDSEDVRDIVADNVRSIKDQLLSSSRWAALYNEAKGELKRLENESRIKALQETICIKCTTNDQAKKSSKSKGVQANGPDSATNTDDAIIDELKNTLKLKDNELNLLQARSCELNAELARLRTAQSDLQVQVSDPLQKLTKDLSSVRRDLKISKQKETESQQLRVALSMENTELINEIKKLKLDSQSAQNTIMQLRNQISELKTLASEQSKQSTQAQLQVNDQMYTKVSCIQTDVAELKTIYADKLDVLNQKVVKPLQYIQNTCNESARDKKCKHDDIASDMLPKLTTMIENLVQSNLQWQEKVDLLANGLTKKEENNAQLVSHLKAVQKEKQKLLTELVKLKSQSIVQPTKRRISDVLEELLPEPTKRRIRAVLHEPSPEPIKCRINAVQDDCSPKPTKHKVTTFLDEPTSQPILETPNKGTSSPSKTIAENKVSPLLIQAEHVQIQTRSMLKQRPENKISCPTPPPIDYSITQVSDLINLAPLDLSYVLVNLPKHIPMLETNLEQLFTTLKTRLSQLPMEYVPVPAFDHDLKVTLPKRNVHILISSAVPRTDIPLAILVNECMRLLPNLAKQLLARARSSMPLFRLAVSCPLIPTNALRVFLCDALIMRAANLIPMIQNVSILRTDVLPQFNAKDLISQCCYFAIVQRLGQMKSPVPAPMDTWFQNAVPSTESMSCVLQTLVQCKSLDLAVAVKCVNLCHIIEPNYCSLLLSMLSTLPKCVPPVSNALIMGMDSLLQRIGRWQPVAKDVVPYLAKLVHGRCPNVTHLLLSHISDVNVLKEVVCLAV